MPKSAAISFTPRDPLRLSSSTILRRDSTLKTLNSSACLRFAVIRGSIHFSSCLNTANPFSTCQAGRLANNIEGREFKDAVFEQFARVAAAFASPKRIEISDLLAQGERNVETLAAETGLSVANTSRHLQVLKASSLLAARKEGLQLF